MKRREAVKDLLRRHQKLLEEEKKIKELEVAANAIIMQLPYTPSKTTREPNVKSHLKDINTKEIALRDTKYLQEKCLKPTLRENLSKENDESRISMKNVSISDYSFNTFYENAKATINKMKIKQHQKEETENSSSCVERGSSIDYSEDFESEKQVFETESTENNLSSISELIEDFTQIEYGISMGSKQFNEIPTDTSNVEKVSESTKDIKQSLNVSSWPTAESIVPHENSGSVPINTEKMEGETATLDSIKEISISQENHISTSKSEETDYSSKQILSTKRSGETIYSKLSGYTSENINSSSNELLPSNIDEELDEDGRICSELSSLKIQITKEEMKENNVGMFEHDADATEVETISTSNKLLHSESENEGKIDLKINSDQDYVADSDKSKPSETIISNSNKSYSKSEEKDKIGLQTKNYEDFVGDSAKTNLTISSGIIISNSKSLYSSEEEDKIELKTKNDEDNVEDSAKTIPTNPSEIINSNSNKSLHSKSEVENEIELKRKSAEDLSKEKYELILTEPLEKYQLTQLNIFDEDKSVIAEDIGKDLISTVNHEFSELKRIDINTDSETSENKNATQNINDELSSTKSKNEIVEKIKTDSATNLFDNEQNQDAIIIKSFEKEETYQDVPSIENNTEQYISEIKTDDTTNKDISEIEDLSELNYSSQDNGLKNKVEFSEKSIEYTDNRNLENNFEQKESIQENDVDENSFQSSQLFREGGSENDYSLSKVVENLSISNKKETEIIEDVYDLKSERDITEIQEEEKLSEQYDIDSTSKTVEKSAKDNSSSSSYSDDFDEDKEDSSSTQEHLHISQKSILDSTLKIEEDGKVSDESEAVLLERDSNNISDHDEKSKIDEIHQEEDKLKSTVQQRVSEILANTVGLQKSPRDKKTNCQDYYVTTYEDISPANSPESVSPVKSTQSVSINTFNNEAEELLKKQLAIELEIKHLEQQQKEQLPFVYMREIPNKPPPPYTPPSTPPNALGIVPARADDLKEICRYSAGVLYKAYTSNNLHAVTFNEKHFKTINNTKSTKECWSFVFDLCKEIAEDHYERFQTKTVPSWLKLPDKPCSKLAKNFTYHQLENYIHNKVRELLRFKKTDLKENSIKRWSKKKKDYVDEILIMESHEEEQEWLNYDNDELMVKNEITDAILDMLLTETIEVYKNIFS